MYQIISWLIPWKTNYSQPFLQLQASTSLEGFFEGLIFAASAQVLTVSICCLCAGLNKAGPDDGHSQ